MCSKNNPVTSSFLTRLHFAGLATGGQLIFSTNHLQSWLSVALRADWKGKIEAQRSVAMKASWHHHILWSVLSLCLLSCALDTYESPFSRSERVFKLGTQTAKPIKQSATGDRRSSPRSLLPASTNPLCQLISRRPSLHRTPRSIQSDFAYLPDVSVTCSTNDFVVRVKPSFYGLGAEAEELKVGSKCKSNGVLRPDGDLLFTYPLTSCDVVREVRFQESIYLHNHEIPTSEPCFDSRPVDICSTNSCSIMSRLQNASQEERTGSMSTLNAVIKGETSLSSVCNVMCMWTLAIYNLQNLSRDHHVYQLAVQPTWETAVVRKRLKGSPSDFQIALMDGIFKEMWIAGINSTF